MLFATGVHRLSICSAIDSCQLFSADGAALLVASGAMHTLRVVKGDKWVQHALGFNRDDKLDTPPTSPRNTEPLCPATTQATLPAVVPKAAPVERNRLPADLKSLDDDALSDLVVSKSLSIHTLEASLGNNHCLRAAAIRWLSLSKLHQLDLSALPVESIQAAWYNQVHGANCESVVGFVPLPVGVVGPLVVDGQAVMLPLATTEGALIASTNRGCKALSAAGVTTAVLQDGISRAPVVKLPGLREAQELHRWTQSHDGFGAVKSAFDSTSNYAKLQKVSATVCGRLCYLRFVCCTGDAMGMNMVSKGTAAAVAAIQQLKPELQMELMSLSGNACADKKATAVNWVERKGKSVVAEAVIPAAVVLQVLKTTPQAMVELNIAKNLVGSAMAGALGGSNAHASNIVTAAFLSTGQDPAQNVESSACLTFMELSGEDLYASVTMPSLEVGTIGGGTSLPAQRACLQSLGVSGASTDPGANSKRLASIIAAAVLAGELSLMAALSTGDLVKSHLHLNRK